jgi:hypothetical protein
MVGFVYVIVLDAADGTERGLVSLSIGRRPDERLFVWALPKNRQGDLRTGRKVPANPAPI